MNYFAVLPLDLQKEIPLYFPLLTAYEGCKKYNIVLSLNENYWKENYTKLLNNSDFSYEILWIKKSKNASSLGTIRDFYPTLHYLSMLGPLL